MKLLTDDVLLGGAVDASAVSDEGVVRIAKATTGLVTGGFEGSQQTLKLDSNGGGTAEYSYDMLPIPDNLILRYEGKEILNTGFVSGAGSGTVTIPSGNSDKLQVILATNDKDTFWEYTISTTLPDSSTTPPNSTTTPTTTPPNSTTTPNIFPTSSNISKDAKYEFIAKDVAYKAGKTTLDSNGKNIIEQTWQQLLGQDVSSIYEGKRFQDIVNGYKVDRVFDDTNTTNTGFFALGLTSTRGDAPVLAIRGTQTQLDNFDVFKDIFADAVPESVGFNQYNKNRITPIEWLSQISKDQNKNPNLLAPDITGHSLGGALTQLFAADFTKQGNKLGDVVTFNSPGIGQSFVNEFKPANAQTVNQYVVSGDVVSLAGEAFLPGKFQLLDFFNLNPVNNHTLPVLTQEVNYNNPTSDKKLADGTSPNSVRRDDTKTVFKSDSVDWLNNPFFTYVEPEYLSLVAGGLELTQKIPQLKQFEFIPPLLLFRTTVEGSRKEIGKGLKQIVDAFKDPLAAVKVPLPDKKFNLLGLIDIQATDLAVKYSKPEDAFKIQGKVTLPSFLGNSAIKATADFAGDNFIQISTKRGLDIKGSLDLQSSTDIVPPLLRVDTAKLSFDTIKSEVKGEASIFLPATGQGIEGGLSLKNGKLDSISLDKKGLGVLIGQTGLSLQNIGGTIGNISAIDKLDPAEILKLQFGLNVGIKNVGSELKIPLPSWAGGEISGSLVELNGGLKIDRDRLNLNGDLKILAGFINGTSSSNIYWNEKRFDSVANISVGPDIFKGQAQLNVDSALNFTLAGKGEVKIPNIPYDVPEIQIGQFKAGGGKINLVNEVKLGEGEFLLKFSNDNDLSNDFIQAYGKLPSVEIPNLNPFAFGSPPKVITPEGTFKLFFGDPKDGSPKVQFQSGNQLPKTGSYTITPDTEWLIMNANWDTATTNVPVQVKTPSGAIINESEFAANNIAIVDSLTTSTTKAVIVPNPTLGIWDIKVANPAGLGNVQYTAFRDSKAPTVQVTNVATDVKEQNISNLPTDTSGQNVTINYNAFDSDSKAKVSFFYDTDNQGFNGILIKDDLDETDGTGSFNWNTEGVPAGDYYIYAMVVDDNNRPVFTYSPNSVRVSEAADLSVTKTANADTATVGNNLTYTVSVTNKGTSNAKEVTLKDTLPEGVEFISASVNPTQKSGNNLTFDIGNLNKGEAKTIKVTVTAPKTGNITGSAQVTSKTFDSDAINDIAVITTSVKPISTDLTITTTGTPTTVNLGDKLTYNLTVTNNSPTKATGVTFTNELPSGLKDVSITSSKGGTTENNNGIVTAELGDLNTGESSTVTINATSIAAGTFSNTASVTSKEADLESANNTLTQRTRVNSKNPDPADLELIQTVDNPNPNVGEQVNITLALTNKGAGIASSINITSLLPPGLNFVSATPEQGRYDNSKGVWDVGNMKDNLTRTLKITAIVTDPNSTTNIAAVTAVNEPDPNPLNNQASLTINPIGSGGSNPGQKAPILGTSGNDNLVGSFEPDVIYGLTGNDTIGGIGETDTLYGNEDDDVINGNQANDLIIGGKGNDLLLGGKGNDQIYGDIGNDTLIGGLGQDILVGGPGIDTFVLPTKGAVSSDFLADTILDFQVGVDKIALTDGLKFSNLMLTTVDNKTVVKIAGNNQILGVVAGVSPSQLSNSFVSSNLL